jgi:hypothetical protein
MPRSPSRDLSDRYIGKRGYFRNPDWIRRWKYLLAAGAFIAACGWAAVDIFQPARAAYGYTHGPLANPHAAYDDQCAACHAPHSASEFGLAAIFHTRDRWHDLTCEKCHSGPTHHASANAEAQAFHNRCSHCHHDHNGRLNSLVRLSDADCTKCHADLGKWHDAAKSKAGTPYQNAITSFATDHPEFRSLNIQKNPRTLKFSHAVHVAPGQTAKMSVARIGERSGPDAAALYRKPGQADDALVTLDCAACHKLDSGVGGPAFDKLKAELDAFGEPTRALAPPRAQGAYFLPVNYEASCRACHPLTAPAGVSAAGGKKFAIPAFPVPHRKQPADLAADLKAGYVKGLIATGHPALAAPLEPGGKLDAQPEPAAPTIAREADRLAAAAAPALLSASAGCAKCHDTTRTGEALAIKPVPNRTVWMAHAKFNHAAHRGATCATCHPGTSVPYNPGAEVVEKEPVQIEGVASCRACHSPAGTKVTLPDGSKTLGGGVRANCTDCHNYHNGDLPLQGRGAESRFPKAPRDLGEWLKGK